MSEGSFDPYDWASFYFGSLSRDEAQNLLSAPEVAVGTFLIRDSSHNGDYSLSVRESGENTVRHYLITKETDGTVKIAEQTFKDIPSLLNHFKIRILDTASLVVPYRKLQIEKVVGIYRFDGERECDLPFEAGEELEIIGKPDNEWWQARNALNTTGLVPANYVTSKGDREMKTRSQTSMGSSGEEQRFSGLSTGSEGQEDRYEPNLPAVAKVLLDRLPNAYDSTQLKLKKGQTITILKKLSNGQYEAEISGQKGFVPFTYVRFTRPQSTLIN